MTMLKINKDETKKEFDELMKEFYKSCTEEKANKIYCDVILKKASQTMMLWGYKHRMYCWYDKKGEKIDNSVVLYFEIHELKRLLSK